MAATTHDTLATLLAPRCPRCREVVPAHDVIVNFGDLQFHYDCRPACSHCHRRLQPEEGGWRSEGTVISEPWGYAIRPTRFLCPTCLGSTLRDEPRAHG